MMLWPVQQNLKEKERTKKKHNNKLNTTVLGLLAYLVFYGVSTIA
jgi:hypothetical protein